MCPEGSAYHREDVQALVFERDAPLQARRYARVRRPRAGTEGADFARARARDLDVARCDGEMRGVGELGVRAFIAQLRI